MAYLTKEIETMNPSVLKDLQNRKLKGLIEYTYNTCKPYRNAMDRKGISPGDIQTVDDISHLPFMDKEFLVANYSYNLLTIPKEKVHRIFLSGGTTGKPIATFYSENDYESVVEAGKRLFPAANLTNKNNFYFGLPIGSHVTLAIYDAANRLGLHSLPAHFKGQDAEKQVEILKDFNIDSMKIAPSGPKGSLQDLIENDKEGYITKNVKTIMFTGGKMTDDAYDFLEGSGITVLPSYGSTEIGGIAYRSSNCDNLARGSMHIFSDLTLVEIVDEEGNKLNEGDKGLVVVTPLGLNDNNISRAMPIIRYILGDEASILKKKCGCGRTSEILTMPERVKDINRLELGCASDI